MSHQFMFRTSKSLFDSDILEIGCFFDSLYGLVPSAVFKHDLRCEVTFKEMDLFIEILHFQEFNPITYKLTKIPAAYKDWLLAHENSDLQESPFVDDKSYYFEDPLQKESSFYERPN